MYTMMSSDLLSHPQIRLVDSFEDLVNTPFQGLNNALCWKRDLAGDFKEIVDQLELEDDITEVSIEDLQALELSAQGQIARDIIIQDLSLIHI